MRTAPRIALIALWSLCPSGLTGQEAASASPQVGFVQLLLNGSGIDPDAVHQEIILATNGPDPVDLTGWSLVATPPVDTPAVWPFPDNTVIRPHRVIWVRWNAPPVTHPALASSDQFYSTGTDIALLDTTAGDLALRSPEGIVHYVQWGRAGQGSEQAAAAAGKWTAGEATDVPQKGDCLAPLGDEGYRAASWQIIICILFTSIDRVSWGRMKTG